MYGGATGEVEFAALTWGSLAPGECDVMQLGRIDVIPGKQSEFIHQDSELIHGDVFFKRQPACVASLMCHRRVEE